MKLIYENDIPPKKHQRAFHDSEKTLKSVRKFGRERWKPNGITDNRKEWEEKSGLAGENEHNRFLIHHLNCEDYKEGHRIDWRK